MRPILFFLLLVLFPVITHAQGTEFVPLLPSLPGISDVQTQNSLAGFLSQIYKICIGLAAVLAVLQIMRAGILYMGGDSITEKKEARGLIATSIAGLLLVLSPVIVFSIINPDILDLNISTERLQSNITVPSGSSEQVPVQNDLGQASNARNDAGGATIAPPPKAPGCTQINNSQIIDDSKNKDVMCCASQENDYAKCEVRRRTGAANAASVAYCGCSIKPNIGNEYEIVYSGPKGTADGGLQKAGIAPAAKAEYDALIAGCAKWGGKLTEQVKSSFFSSSFHACPTSAGVADDPQKTIKCRTVLTQCVNQP